MRLLNRLIVLLLACIVTCLVISRTLAQAVPSPYTTRVAPPKVHTNPYANPEDPYEPVKAKMSKLDKAAHLRLAAEHLAAAGKTELAEQITNESLIEAKLEQIRELQTEVERLRAGTETQQVLTVQLKIIELQTSEMRKLGFDFQAADGTPGSTLFKAGEIDGLVDALQKQALARVLAEPTLVTVSGRSASFQSGSEIPIIVPQSLGTVSVEYRQIGTRVDCVGTILGSGRIRLELHSTVSEIDASRGIVLQDISVPGLRTRKIDTAVEMDAGQTVVLCGMTQKSPKDETDSDDGKKKSLLVAVTVHLGEPVAATASKAQPRR